MRALATAAKATAPTATPPHAELRDATARPHGNQAMLRRLQAKLRIGAVDDPLEREADDIASRMLHVGPAPAPTVGVAPRVARACSTCEEDVQRRGTALGPPVAPPSVAATLSTPGTPLPAGARQFFAARLAADLGAVRVHTDAAAARSAEQVGALAYTVGERIVFAPGQFAPDTAPGRALLAHELVHVMQQSGGRDRPGSVRRDTPKPADRATMIKDFKGYLKDKNWQQAALTLNGMNSDDIDRMLGDLDNDQLRAINDAAPVIMPGWPPVVQDHIAPLLKEAERVATLKTNYDAALAATPRSWDNIAVLLNGFSERDILLRLRALAPEDLRSLDASVQKVMAQWPDRLHRLALRVMLEGAQPDPTSAPGTAPRTTGSTGATAPMSAADLAKASEKTQAFFNTRDATAREFGAVDYDDYVRNRLIGGGTVFGHQIPTLHPVHPKFLDKLETASVKARAAIGSNEFGVASVNGQDNRAGNHAWGLAVDIDPGANPYIINEAGEADLDKSLAPVYQRIATSLLHRDSFLTRDQPGKPSGLRSATWSDLAEESDAMVAYFSVLPELAAKDPAAGAKAAPGLPPPRKLTAKVFSAEDLGKLDVAQVRTDYQLLLGNPKPAKGDAPFTGGGAGNVRDPARGFLTLRQEVVEALRGQGLRWGATDFPGASGDVMHFDDGEHVADYKTWGASNPTKRRATESGAATPAPVPAASPAPADTVQKKSGPGAIGAAPGEAPPSVDAALARAGTPLDATTRAYFEPRLGHDLGRVRVHTDAPSARALGARAYTSGRDIVFAPGQFDTGSAPGRALLAHELVHVVQQAGLATHRSTLQRAPEDPSATPAQAPAATPAAGLTVVPCASLPRTLGLRGGCGRPSDTDFMSLDFPKLGTLDSLKVAPFRLQSDIDLLKTMVTDLAVLAGGDGVDATKHFADGTGTKTTFNAGDNLADLAAKSASFTTAAETVRAMFNLAVSSQAAGGSVACDTLNLPGGTLPRISFGFRDAVALKAVIGGTHGLRVNLVSFAMSPASLSYTAELQFVICDNFGVDEADLYWPSLLAFWVLQHERAGYRPFVNEIVLNKTFTDTI